MRILRTQRLSLIALDAGQLRAFLDAPEKLEAELGLTLSRAVVTGAVRGAIAIKLARMERMDARHHPWFTYWLVVEESLRFGAGLVGYKGLPDHNGEIEIGYGIDPAYQNKGYITEAVQALVRWAFHQPACQAVAAQVIKNPASERVLEKAGFRLVSILEGESSWRLTKEDWRQLSSG